MQDKKVFIGKDASAVLLVAIALLLIGGTAFSVYFLRSDPIQEFIAEDRVISMMYVIEENGSPLGTFVVMFYPGTGRAAVFDIPGDIGMLIRRLDLVDRIDTVYDPRQMSAYRELVGSLLGTEISFSAIIGTENLARTVDLLEGLELFVPSAVDYRDGSGMQILLPSGIHRFDGDKAVTFMTYAEPGESDELVWHRRQRFFLSFLQRQAEMNDDLKIPEVSRLFRSFVQMDISDRARMRLLDELARTDIARISVQRVGGTSREVSGQTLIIPSQDGYLIRDVVRRTLSSITRPVEGADRPFTVEVLNGTGIAGLAGKTRDLLREFGYDVIYVGNAEHSGYENTTVIDRSGYEEMAKNFAGVIRCGNLVFEDPYFLQGESRELKADFTLIIGRDFDGRYVVAN